jgi:hypothetical protein
MAKPPKINVTKNYRLFRRSDENRPLDLKRHRKLDESMKENGFLPCYPIICKRDAAGQLIIKDGQHRLAFAEKHALPVYWIEVDDATDFDVATINNTQKTWLPSDYAKRFADGGSADYAELIEFKDEHGIPLTTGAMLLAGVTGFNSISESFYDGSFKVKDRHWAKSVVSVYTPIVNADKKLKGMVLLLACMAAARVKNFSAKRLIDNLGRCRNKLAHFGSRDAYLEMLEKIYNFGRTDLVSLKNEAVMEMRKRNPRTRGKDDGCAPEAA